MRTLAKMLDYLLVTAVALGVTYAVIAPVARGTVDAFHRTAALIEDPFSAR